MKVLLIGCEGQLGFELSRSLAPLGPLRRVSRQECDLANHQALRELIRTARPEVIVNAAAYTAVDKAEDEPELAMAINATAVGVIGEEAVRSGALVVHYSTDYVFPGDKDGSYSEEDAVGPLNTYGQSKLAGEQALQQSRARYLIFRASWIVGAHGDNFAKTVLRLAAQRESVTIVADQFGAPTSAALVADVTAHVLKRLSEDVQTDYSGVYHLTAGGVTSWHEYACHVVARARQRGVALKLGQDGIRPIPAASYPTKARRPSNSRMNSRKLCERFGIYLPDWREGIDHVLEQLL